MGHKAGATDNEMDTASQAPHRRNQGNVLDTCLQFHGGYGYMDEYQTGMYRDARISRIYGGPNGIMRMLIAGRCCGAGCTQTHHSGIDP
jgi:hypothetical protein